MQRCAALFSLLGFLLSAPVFAQDSGPVVVELFTSQGCSSCPPADALMHDLAERDDVIGLALHVDYWDYIGWKDAFARPEHTVRQKKYAHVAKRRMIYTPQMVINGRDAIVGAKAMKLFDAIAAHKAQAPRAHARIARDGGRLEIAVGPGESALDGMFELHLVRYQPLREVDIKRGENAGRFLRYANVVETWQTLQDWDGRAEIAIETEIQGDLPVVLLVQGKGAGPIVAAAALR